MVEFGLGLYLIVGIGLAEWGLRRSDVRENLWRIGPRKGYLLLVTVGPLKVLWLGTITMVRALGHKATG
ncbi:MAG: hypothetical protein AAF950_18125 [Pseudomonadota bacterium]